MQPRVGISAVHYSGSRKYENTEIPLLAVSWSLSNFKPEQSACRSMPVVYRAPVRSASTVPSERWSRISMSTPRTVMSPVVTATPIVPCALVDAHGSVMGKQVQSPAGVESSAVRRTHTQALRREEAHMSGTPPPAM